MWKVLIVTMSHVTSVTILCPSVPHGRGLSFAAVSPRHRAVSGRKGRQMGLGGGAGTGNYSVIITALVY